MTAQDLKNSILQLAIQGKLVEQRPEEGTAKELLEQIKVEKEQLMKEGKIKKDKPLPVIIDDEIPFEIPENWEWVRLSSICTKLVDGDHNPPKGEFVKTPYIMASSTNINRDAIVDLEKVRYLSEKVFLKVNERTNVTEGDILFTSVGTLGRSCIYNGEYNICFQRSVSVMTTLILNIYLKYCFDSSYFQYKIIREATGTAQKGFYLNQLAFSLIPIPPFEEQKRIVAKIEELLPFVEQYDKAYSKLEVFNKKFPADMQKSILQYAIQGKLVEQRPEEGTAEELYQQIQAEKAKLIKEDKIKKEKPLGEITDEEIPFEIPESWKWVRLRDIGITQTGNTPSKNNVEYFGNFIPFISPGDILNGLINYNSQGLSKLGKEVGRVSETNSILQVCIGGSIGKCAINAMEVSYNQQINAITPLACNYLFVYYLMDSRFFLTSMLNKATGTATPIINKSSWESIIVPLPPLEEQKRIVEAIQTYLPYCQQLIK